MSNEMDIPADINIQSLKYKSKMSYGTSSCFQHTSSATDLSSLDKFLENEKVTNSNEPWSKLDKTAKLRKFACYATKFKTEHNLSEEEVHQLTAFFRDCLDKKKLQRVKDVIYNKETGEITDIPALCFNKTINHFTLKNIDKRVSTLKGLTPKKKHGTIKNTHTHSDSD